MNIEAIGHVMLRVADPERAVAFYRDLLELKHVVKGDYFNAFELAGHTHLCLLRGEPEPERVGFDFLARDVDALHRCLHEAGVSVTQPQDDDVSGHRSFVLTDVDGYKISVSNNTHVDLGATGDF